MRKNKNFLYIQTFYSFIKSLAEHLPLKYQEECESSISSIFDMSVTMLDKVLRKEGKT
jgi:hypothetical protein